MPLDTNLNVSPYWDDYNEDKNFHRVLFRPGVAVQARELTQLQSILQNQVERFGDNIYKTGTIIRGCNLTTDPYYNYIKILDSQNNGQPASMPLYSNSLIVQESSNLQAISVSYATGYESQDPDLNTIYLKYQNTGTGGEKTFASSQTVKVFDRDRTIEDVTISIAGTLYSNNDTVSFTGGGGSGAAAIITTDVTGQITDVSVTSKGSGYTTLPNVSITTSTGSGASLVAKNYIAELTVSSVANAVGVGMAVKTTEGIIYQKGNFIRVDPQTTILQKYSSVPEDKVVGFAVTESLVNSNTDSTLLDLATGTPNYSAPGANRLQLTPTLAVFSKAEAAANSKFLALLEYQDGLLIKNRSTTQFNSINTELAKRTYEESGNYVINTLPLDTEDISSNTTHFNLIVGSGTAYVNGERIDLLNSIRVPVRKANTTANSESQIINTQYGSYVLVKELVGTFEIKEGTTVYLRNEAGTDVTDNVGGVPSTPGTIIGVAKARSLTYDSGVPGTPDATYKLFIFDVRMYSGRSFSDVRSISINSTALADVSLINGAAVLQDVESDILVFRTGAQAIKQLTNEQFIFRTSTNSTFLSTGTQTISYSGANTLPYGDGTLTDTQAEDFIVIPQANIVHSSNGAGTVATTSGQANVNGTSTSFLSDFEIGDYIAIGANDPKRITSIYSNTKLALDSTVGYSAIANAYYKSYPANVPIDFRKSGKTISVGSSGTTLTIDLGASIGTTPAFTVYHDMLNDSPGVRSKTANTPYVKLSTDSLASTTTGPWCLGIPDVLSIEAVYIGSSNSYSESTVNYATEFELDNGQRDNYYGLAYLRKAPGSSLTLTSSNCLLVKLKCFTHSAGSYLSSESYPVDDSTTPLPANKLRTEQIPLYTSATTGESISLRDSVDFRPIVSNTAVLASSAGSASIDPSTTEILTTGEKYFPSPIRSFECDIESYLSRNDRIVMGNDGRVRIVEGIPDVNPPTPQSEKGVMDLGIIRVKPYPSLTAKAAADAKRPDLKTTIVPLQTRRYTMENISSLEQRLQRLEYYTLLNTLEANAATLAIPSESNSSIEVFKNGFLVDSFDTYKVADINDGEFKSQINTTRSRLIPQEDLVSIDLKFSNTTSLNVKKTGDLVLLNYTETELLSQPFANKERTLVEQNWLFSGKMFVTPKVDNFFDTEATATTSLDFNLADPLTDLVNAQNEINARLTGATSLISQSSKSSTTTSQVTRYTGYNTTTTTTSSTYQKTATEITAPPTVTSQKTINNLLTSAYVSPYVRAQRIGVYMSGLRPGAQHYVYFDGVDLTSNSVPCSLSSTQSVTTKDFVPLYNKDSTTGLFANNTGELAVLIDIPADTFTTGEKEILVMDVSTLLSESSATSKALGKFASFAMNGTAQNITLSTKTFDLSGAGFTANTFTSRYTQNTSTTTTQWFDNTPSTDPLAQTFFIQKQKGGDYVFLTSVDLYFKQKDSEKGVALELRETNDAGYITNITLPFSRVYKKSSEVYVSNNASLATNFAFESPVCARVNKDYGMIIMPDGNSPEYRVWTGQTGFADVANTSAVMNQSWGLGTLFYSTGGVAYSAVQNEDLKFKVNRAEFSSTSGTAALQNGDYEFLTINAVSGSFVGGEDVVQMANSYLNVQLTTNTSSYVINTNTSLTSTITAGDYVLVVYGTANSVGTANVKVTGTSVTNADATNTEFTSKYSNGDFIKIGNEVRLITNVASDVAMSVDAPFNATITDSLHFEVTPKFDVLKVSSANSTTITVNRPPSYSTNSTSLIVSGLQKVVHGTVSYYKPTSGKLHIKDSNSANSTFLVKTSNSTYFAYIVGDTSDAIAKVVSIDNIEGTSFIPLINTLQVPTTSSGLTATFTKSGGGTATSNYNLAGKNTLTFNDKAVVKSLSNEISGTTITKSFNANVSLGTTYTDTSSVLDIAPSSIVLQKYVINNSLVNENTRYGNASSKYISKRLELADGLDAEDVKVFVKAYRPSGTDIKVYAKVLNSTDNESFNDKDWSLLEMTTSSALVSSTLDVNDLKEYEYTFSRTPTASVLTGVAAVTTSCTSIAGVGTSWNTDLTENDIIKIVYSSSTNDYDIIPVTAVNSSSNVTLAFAPSTINPSVKIEKVTNKKMAFKYAKNSGIVRYYDGNRGAHDSYKYLAVKVVLTSTLEYVAPEVDDIRVIAISV